jgi:hypothetical protein
MTPDHWRWDEFYGRLEGAEGCDFKDEPPGSGNVTWRCKGGTDQSLSEEVLRAMGATDEEVEASLAYFSAHGGHCDCEVLFNVAS